MPAGAAFVEAIRRVWDAGDAVFPLDQRLPRGRGEACHRRRAADRGHRCSRGAAPLVGRRAGSSKTMQSWSPPPAQRATQKLSSTPTLLVAASAQATSDGLDADPASDIWLACLPPAHIGGLAVIMRALHTGSGWWFTRPLIPRPPIKRTQSEGVTLVSLVTESTDAGERGRVPPRS